jgi:hypothetical protein
MQGKVGWCQNFAQIALLYCYLFSILLNTTNVHYCSLPCYNQWEQGRPLNDVFRVIVVVGQTSAQSETIISVKFSYYHTTIQNFECCGQLFQLWLIMVSTGSKNEGVCLYSQENVRFVELIRL